MNMRMLAQKVEKTRRESEAVKDVLLKKNIILKEDLNGKQ